jgi:hypothetical protein
VARPRRARRWSWWRCGSSRPSPAPAVMRSGGTRSSSSSSCGLQHAGQDQDDEGEAGWSHGTVGMQLRPRWGR